MGPAGSRCGIRGQALAEVIECIEQGRVSKAEVSPADLIAAVTFDALGGEHSEGLALTHGAPKRPKLAAAVGEAGLSHLLPGRDRVAVLTIAAGLLQILDAWDASHEAAQAADDLGEHAFSAYWHGIGHRREPDAANATYWFRRVGRHSLFPSLVEPARAILQEPGCPAQLSRVVRDETWDPFAFIDSCARCRQGSIEERWLRRIQRLRDDAA